MTTLRKEPPNKPWAYHGWEWCEIYLDLVRYMLGRETHLELKQSFKLHRVRFSPPIKRHLTEEARQVLRDRLNRGRERTVERTRSGTMAGSGTRREGGKRKGFDGPLEAFEAAMQKEQTK